MRRRSRRPPRTSRPAAEKIRSRSRLGSQGPGGAVEGEHLHPGGEFAGHGDQLAPDLVLRVAVQRQVAQAGVFGGADAVLAAGAAAVAQFQVTELAASGVRGEAGDAVPVDDGRSSPAWA
jgi:hypothetical protein